MEAHFNTIESIYPRTAQVRLFITMWRSRKHSLVWSTLDMYLGRNRGHVRLHVGENVRADIGQPHTFSNTSSSPCIMTVETRPAGGVVKAFQLAYGSANEGKANKDGLPRNLLIRLLFIEISQGYLPQIPLGLQRFILTLTTIVSRLTGMERRIQQYLTD